MEFKDLQEKELLVELTPEELKELKGGAAEVNLITEDSKLRPRRPFPFPVGLVVPFPLGVPVIK